MNEQPIIVRTIEFVKKTMQTQGGDHDWWHVYRVWQLAKRIAGEEKDADLLATELAALLHDLADPKIIEETGVSTDDIAEWLKSSGVEDSVVERVMTGLHKTSFSSTLSFGGKQHGDLSAEAKIISDCDKLDAMGAIGIARAFAYAGKKRRMLHDPERGLRTYANAEEYHASDTPAVAHFHEKLLLLKDLMYTETAKKLAAERHKYMEQFLEQFNAEWEGKK